MDEGQDSARLNKFLALRLGNSRREANELIASGRVKINGTPAMLGARVKVGDVISVDGQMLSADEPAHFIYLMLNKPAGYVCSRRQQGENPTIYDLLPPEY